MKTIIIRKLITTLLLLLSFNCYSTTQYICTAHIACTYQLNSETYYHLFNTINEAKDVVGATTHIFASDGIASDLNWLKYDTDIASDIYHLNCNTKEVKGTFNAYPYENCSEPNPELTKEMLEFIFASGMVLAFGVGFVGGNQR